MPEPARPAGQETCDARRTLNHVLLATLAVCLTLLSLRQYNLDSASLLAAVVVVVAGLALNRWRGPELAATVTLTTLLLLTAEAAFRARDGVRSVVALIFPTLLLLAALLMRLRWFLGYAIAILAVVAAVGWIDMQRFRSGTPPARSPTTGMTVFTIELILGLGATVAGLLVQNLQRGLQRTREASARLSEANQALQTSESMFRTLVDLAADAIFIASPEGAVLNANQKACSLTGFGLDELKDRTITGLFQAEPASAGGLALDRFREEGHGPFNALVHCRDGSMRPVELNSKLMPGHVIQIICRDITERLQTEERIQQLQKLESIGLLAGGVAHDFNNLLTVINGFAALALQRLNPGDPLRRHIEQIQKAGLRGADLTAQLLAFGRKQLIRPAPVHLNRLIEEHREMLARLMGEGILLTTDLAPDVGVILADPGLFHQILINLAANARDAMPHGGRFSIATQNVADPASSEKKVRLTVSDTGAGMTEDVRRRIFEPFFTTKEEGHGTGLGLPTVYGIVQQMGGTVAVESKPGAGTTFHFLFPQIEAEAPAGEHVESPAAAATGGETVVVVEDNSGVRAYVSEVLSGLGYRVITAEDARSALDQLAAWTGPVHLLLTDVVLPGMDGRELADRVLQKLPHVRVLFMSGYAEDRLTGPAAPEDGLAHLPKPFSAEVLAAKVREVLKSRA
jgi:PAS domain S-box-containing protein